eukprot:m.186049 g.186049  ORF g.186049 m.186049 type:complete len:899 (-) comp18128_c0_seq3:143-2839(-)
MGKPSPWVVSYVQGVARTRWLVIAFWAVLAGFGLWLAPVLLANCTFAGPDIPGTTSAKANDKLMQYFPETEDLPVVILLNRTNGKSPLGPDMEKFTHLLSSRLLGLDTSVKATSVTSYYSLKLMGLDVIANHTITETATIIVVTVDKGISDQTKVVTFGRQVYDITTDTASECFKQGSIYVGLTGEIMFSLDILDGVEHDLLFMDGIAFPVALAVLASVLHSPRLLIIPVVNIIVGSLVSCLIMYGVSTFTMVFSFAPSMMASACIAMSIDYSLFLLTRFGEEIQRGRSLVGSAAHTMATAGHTIVVTGLTLAACFFGLLMFPTIIMSSPGVGTGIAILATLVVNLTLTPALLFAFGDFFVNGILLPNCCKRRSALPFVGTTPEPLTLEEFPEFDDFDDGDDDEALLVPSASPQDGAPSTTDVATDTAAGKGTANQVNVYERDYPSVKDSWFYKLGVVVLKRPILVTVLISAFVVPFGVYFFKMDHSIDFVYLTPRGSKATLAFDTMAKTFGAGFTAPYSVLIVPPKTVEVKSDAFFSTTAEILADLELSGGPINVVSPVRFYGENQTWSDMAPCLQEVSQCLLPSCKMACALVSQYVSFDDTAMRIDVQLLDDTTSTEGVVWLRSARITLNRWQDKTGYHIYLAQGAASMVDVSDAIYDLFPVAIAAVFSSVFVLIAIGFRSLVIPFRLVYSLSLTVCFVYGAAVFVYQYGALDWLSIAGLKGHGNVFFLSPILSFSIVVGLGLDYDVFLLSRVREYRLAGLSDYNSLLFALGKTGSIITAAGCIMAIAFGGLIFSNEQGLNEVSFYLTLAVLFDTFVIRTILVPATMKPMGRFNWWPTRMPEPKWLGPDEGASQVQRGRSRVAGSSRPRLVLRPPGVGNSWESGDDDSDDDDMLQL